MSKTTIPTRSHVLDMFHAGVRSGQPATARTQPDNPGYFDSGTATAIPPDEGHRILGLLRGIAQGGDLEVVKKLPNGAGRIRYRINCSKFVDLPTAQQRYRSAKAELWVTNARTGTSTPVVVVLRWANFGANCWLNVQANPTSLLTGTNAVAAGLNLGRRRERLYMFRYPYLVLQRLLRAVDAGFAWSEPTAQRLRTGDFSLHNVQVALYLPLGSREKLRRFLN